MPDNLHALARLDYLDQDETTTVIQALTRGEQRPISQGEAHAIVDWCNSAITSAVLVGLLINGEITVEWSPQGDDWVFSKS